jgi:hypothetical protein
MLHSIPTGELYGSVSSRNEQVEIAINGERVALMDINFHMDEKDPNGMNITTPRIHVTAGPQHVTAAFIQRFEGPVDDLVAPIDYTLADTEPGDAVGITTLPHLRDFSITGPFTVTGVSDTPSRRRIFSCRPLSASEEIPCARKIVTSLVGQAYRRQPTGEDVESLMGFYADARKGKDFEAGIRAIVQAGAGKSALPVPTRRNARRNAAGSELPHHRPRSRVAAFVLSCGRPVRMQSC